MALSQPLAARYADYAPEFPAQVRTRAQQAGISFERAVAKRLASLHKDVKPGPWLHYTSGKTSNVCQPDVLVWLRPDFICIVECKLTWVRDARRKLLTFYGPIVQAIHPDVELCYLQVYRNAKRGCHKRPITLYQLDDLKPGNYKECHHVS